MRTANEPAATDNFTRASELALADLKVVEIATGVAGPYCGKLLADFGADVVKVELPTGDPSRVVGPFPAGDKEAGALFLWLNANKRGITLDWQRASGRRVLRELLDQADVLIDSGPTATLSRLRLSHASLARRNPRLITASATPFGSTGPWRDRPGTDLTVSALGGISFLNGQAGEEPLKEPGPQSDAVAGVFACIGVLCALADRSRTGEGQAVDVSAMEAMLGILTPYILQFSYQGRSPQRRPAGTESIYAVEDGHVSVTPPNQNGWRYLTEVLDMGDSASDPAVVNEASRRVNADRMRALLGNGLSRHNKTQAFHALAEGRVNVGMVLSIPELIADPHLQARRFFSRFLDPQAGELICPGPPFRLSLSDWNIRRPAPRPGEHTEEVLKTNLDYSPRRLASLHRVGVIGGRGTSPHSSLRRGENQVENLAPVSPERSR